MLVAPSSERRPSHAGVRRRGGMRRPWGALSLALLAISALNVVATATPTTTERILASLLIALAAWVAAAWTRGAPWTSAFLVLFTCLYVVYFALPIFVLGAYTRAVYLRNPIPDEYIEEALGFAFAGLVMCIASYRLMGLRPVARRFPLPSLDLDWDAAKVRRFGVASGIGGVVAYQFLATTPVPQVVEQLAYHTMDLSLLGILMLWAVQLGGHLGRGRTLLLWLGLVPARFGLGLALGGQGSPLPEIGDRICDNGRADGGDPSDRFASLPHHDVCRGRRKNAWRDSVREWGNLLFPAL